MSVVMIIRLAILGVVILAAVPVMLWGFWFARKQTKPHVVIENPTKAAIEITVDGKSVGTVPASGGKIVQLDPGAHDVVAGGDKAKITVPDTSGYRGLYAVGGKSSLASVTVYYSTAGKGLHEDKVEPVVFGKGERLASLPASMAVDAMDIDKPFLATIEIPQGSLETSVTHLCHVHDKDDDFVGCPGF
jgi:uncharacterized protein YneF (UPF0154 family)